VIPEFGRCVRLVSNAIVPLVRKSASVLLSGVGAEQLQGVTLRGAHAEYPQHGMVPEFDPEHFLGLRRSRTPTPSPAGGQGSAQAHAKAEASPAECPGAPASLEPMPKPKPRQPPNSTVIAAPATLDAGAAISPAQACGPSGGLGTAPAGRPPAQDCGPSGGLGTDPA
jgi:hypothetical protein